MTDPLAVTVKSGEHTLSLRCTYAVMLKLEETGDWRETLSDAISIKSPTALVRVGAAFAEISEEELTKLSPPVADLSEAIGKAWDVCMRGPVALRDYLGEDKEDEGKPETETKPVSTASLSTPSDRPSALVSANESSGS